MRGGRKKEKISSDSKTSKPTVSVGVFEVDGVPYYFVERPTTHLPMLSQAEREVVSCALAGLSNAEIAEKRGCSRRTVENQLAGAYKKLGVGSRRELCAKFAREPST